MPDDRMKMFSKKGTGTVPKAKHRNNTNQNDFQRNLPNNLGFDWQRHDIPSYSRNSGRNFYPLNTYTMDTSTFSEGISHLNLPGTANGVLSTSSTSGSTSRRDSVGTIPKCDNVKKCPDKKQIEDKLNQIREYIQVTTSLMSSIKNDDQSAVNERAQFEKMIKELRDSEAKLLVLLNDELFDDNEQATLQNVEVNFVNDRVSLKSYIKSAQFGMHFSVCIDALSRINTINYGKQLWK